MKRTTNRFYPWEIALLLGLSLTLLTGLQAGARQRALAEKVLRLHVIAVSDSEEDQAEKLRVRDAVLDVTGPALKNARSAREAEIILRAMLPSLEEAARSAAGGETVELRLGPEHYPTRVYEDFAMPPGEYSSLQVRLGAAEGQNWWCVVYPPLCREAAAESVRETGALTEEELRLITGDGREYELRFRLLELWDRLTAAGRKGE